MFFFKDESLLRQELENNATNSNWKFLCYNQIAKFKQWTLQVLEGDPLGIPSPIYMFI